MGASDIGDSIKASGEVCGIITSSSGVGVRGASGRVGGDNLSGTESLYSLVERQSVDTRTWRHQV